MTEFDKLNIESSHFKIADKTISEVANMDMLSLDSWLKKVEKKSNSNELKIAKQVLL